MVADGLRRARRIVQWTLYAMLVLPWFFAGVNTVAEVATGTVQGVRVLFATAGLLVFSWLYVRIIRAVLDRRYARREIVAAAVVSLAVAIVGGVQMAGWGLAPSSGSPWRCWECPAGSHSCSARARPSS